MQFQEMPLNHPFNLVRLESETGRWALGCRLVSRSDLRVTLYLPSEVSYELDYYCGEDLEVLLAVLQAVRLGLFFDPEDLWTKVLHQRFPVQSIRPVLGDPTCWGVLSQIWDNAQKRGAECQPICVADLSARLAEAALAKEPKFLRDNCQVRRSN